MALPFRCFYFTEKAHRARKEKAHEYPQATDYSILFSELDRLMAEQLSQMNLYCEIGRLVSSKAEKGAAVAASEYLQAAYPAAEGFSPRNLRRMRAFYAVYEKFPEIMRLAMNLGWTQNVAILERCGSNEERVWYIRAVLCFGWKKAKLLEAIGSGMAAFISRRADGFLLYW